MKMGSLQNQLFTLCIALSCVSRAAGVIHVSGYEGTEVKVSCSYGEGYESYEKYLCKNDCSSDDVLITTTETKKNRYSIYDDERNRVFTATISPLRREDAGKYWCGVSRSGKDIYTEVKLDVRQDSCCSQSTKVQSYETGSVSISCPYESKYQNNMKYICRGNQASTCLGGAVITSDNQQKGRFALTDDKVSSKFTVNITSLTQKDSGSYLCGVHSNTELDVFSAVELEVKEWCCVKSIKEDGIVGRPLTLQCPFPPQHSNNRKFLCKGDHRNNCTEMVTSQIRFTLQHDDSSSSFSVTITELKEGDAATYWCGSDSQWSPGDYTKIQLSVVFPQQTSTVTPPFPVEPAGSQLTVFPQQTSTVTPPFPVEPAGSQSTEAALFHPVVFAVPAVLLVLLVLTFGLVVVYKYKCYKVQGAGVNMNTIKTKAVEAEEAMGGEDIYENQDVVASSRQGTSKLQGNCYHGDDAGKDQPVYQNFNVTDDIYCNQIDFKVNKR